MFQIHISKAKLKLVRNLSLQGFGDNYEVTARTAMLVVKNILDEINNEWSMIEIETLLQSHVTQEKVIIRMKGPIFLIHINRYPW